jgi:uncharacterized protein with PIN domain
MANSSSLSDASSDHWSDPDEARFVMDFSLYRVAKQLRLLGYDTVCDRTVPHEHVVRRAQRDGRVLVTASTKLVPMLDRLARESRRPPIERTVVGYDSDGESIYASSDDGEVDGASLTYILINTNQPFDDQLRYVVRQAGLQWRPDHIFTRCVGCNVLISAVEKPSIQHLVNPAVYSVYENFYQCKCCKKVYWGLDNGVVINYKSLRTVENLRRFCVPQETTTRDVGRHILSLPRVIKVAIFSFLDANELPVVIEAYPALSGLLQAIAAGTSTKFVPSYKRKAKVNSE